MCPLGAHLPITVGFEVAAWLLLFVPPTMEIYFPTLIKNSLMYCAVASISLGIPMFINFLSLCDLSDLLGKM